MSRLLSCRAGALWSLAEMIWKYGELILRANSSLQFAEAMWNTRATGSESDLTFAQTIKDRSTSIAIDDVRRLAALTDWDSLDRQIERLETKRMLESGASLIPDLEGLRNRIWDELAQEHFFHLSVADVPLYLNDEPFGQAVSKAFPKAIEDIAEAAKCLALQRSTACVFHLMRVMEQALRTLAKRLKVKSINLSIATWNDITNHMNRAIEALPAQNAKDKARKVKFGTALAHLNSVRIAWRNEVMHPKQSYTREEAHTIFAAVRAFMIDLAALK